MLLDKKQPNLSEWEVQIFSPGLIIYAPFFANNPKEGIVLDRFDIAEVERGCLFVEVKSI